MCVMTDLNDKRVLPSGAVVYEPKRYVNIVRRPRVVPTKRKPRPPYKKLSKFVKIYSLDSSVVSW